MFYVCHQIQTPVLQISSMKLAVTFRDECGGELRKLGLGPGLEHSSGARFGNWGVLKGRQETMFCMTQLCDKLEGLKVLENKIFFTSLA